MCSQPSPDRPPVTSWSPATTQASWGPIPTGIRAWIEDVVVDGAARGKGVGDALNRHAIDLAADLGAKTVDLTSRPSREAANRLYKRLGFEQRDTNVYRFAGA